MLNCWIFDIDGTLADTSNRQHFLDNGKKDWDGWFRNIGDDPVHDDVAQFYDYAISQGIRVIICTGRDEAYREATESWLAANQLLADIVYMRPLGDRRDDSVIKKEMLDDMRSKGYNPVMVFEDRDRVVKMWRENGIRCMQVASGDF